MFWNLSCLLFINNTLISQVSTFHTRAKSAQFLKLNTQLNSSQIFLLQLKKAPRNKGKNDPIKMRHFRQILPTVLSSIVIEMRRKQESTHWIHKCSRLIFDITLYNIRKQINAFCFFMPVVLREPLSNHRHNDDIIIVVFGRAN